MTDPRPDPVFNDEAEVLAVLQRLVGQLKGSGYRDREGHPIENNEAFMMRSPCSSCTAKHRSEGLRAGR